MNRPHSVTRNGCKRKLRDEQAVDRPMTAEPASTTAAAAHGDTCCSHQQAEADRPRPTTEPIDRSMPPEMISTPTPRVETP